MHVLAGSPGTGKTTLCLSMIATITAGMPWPDGSACAPADCLLWSGEDAWADTLLPRLMRMGADLARVLHVAPAAKPNGKASTYYFDPSRDIPAVEAAVAMHGPGLALACLDPLVAVTKGVDSYKNAETRNSLQPVIDLAEHQNCAVLGVHHLTKGSAGAHPLDRVSGSLAFGAAPRIVLFAAHADKTKSDESYLLVKAKANIATDRGGFSYDIDAAPLYENPTIEATRIVWGQKLEGYASEILADSEQQPASTEKAENKVDLAEGLLLGWLAPGPLPSNTVVAKAELEGISERTIMRAKRRLSDRIEINKAGKVWLWKLKR
jgi:hypothetical protein